MARATLLHPVPEASAAVLGAIFLGAILAGEY